MKTNKQFRDYRKVDSKRVKTRAKVNRKRYRHEKRTAFV